MENVLSCNTANRKPRLLLTAWASPCRHRETYQNSLNPFHPLVTFPTIQPTERCFHQILQAEPGLEVWIPLLRQRLGNSTAASVSCRDTSSCKPSLGKEHKDVQPDLSTAGLATASNNHCTSGIPAALSSELGFMFFNLNQSHLQWHPHPWRCRLWEVQSCRVQLSPSKATQQCHHISSCAAIRTPCSGYSDTPVWWEFHRLQDLQSYSTQACSLCS